MKREEAAKTEQMVGSIKDRASSTATAKRCGVVVVYHRCDAEERTNATSNRQKKVKE